MPGPQRDLYDSVTLLVGTSKLRRRCVTDTSVSFVMARVLLLPSLECSYHVSVASLTCQNQGYDSFKKKVYVQLSLCLVFSIVVYVWPVHALITLVARLYISLW